MMRSALRPVGDDRRIGGEAADDGARRTARTAGRCCPGTRGCRTTRATPPARRGRAGRRPGSVPPASRPRWPCPTTAAARTARRGSRCRSRRRRCCRSWTTMRISPTQLVVRDEDLEDAGAGQPQDRRQDAAVDAQVLAAHGQVAAPGAQRAQLVEDADAAPDGGRDGGAGDAQRGNGPTPNTSNGPSTMLMPLASHSVRIDDAGVAGAAERGVDQEQQDDGHAAAQHHAREAAADRRPPRARRPSRPAAWAPDERADDPDHDRQRRRRATIACTAARAAPSGSFSPMRRATTAAPPIDSPIANA